MGVCSKLREITTPLMSERPRRLFPEEHVSRSPNQITCFKSVLAGIGMLTEHCIDQSSHGDEADAYSEPGVNVPLFCGAGKGAHLWRFRLKSMEMIGAIEKPAVCSRLQVLVSVRKAVPDDRFMVSSAKKWIEYAKKMEND